MNIKQLVGIIYLIVFIGVLGYRFNDSISGFAESPVLIALVLLVILFLVFFIRKILYDS